MAYFLGMYSQKQKNTQKVLFWAGLIALLFLVSEKGVASLGAVLGFFVLGLMFFRGILISHLLLNDLDAQAKKTNTTSSLLLLRMILNIVLPSLILTVILTYVLVEYWYPYLERNR